MNHITSNIISGIECAAEITAVLQETIKIVAVDYSLVPTLAIIIVGNDAASLKYVENKIKVASRIGIQTIKIHLASSVTEAELLDRIMQLNSDPTISGIIVQLPLPLHIDKDLVLTTIMPSKDVDGFHPLNVGYLHSNTVNSAGPVFIPCTALGCLTLIKKYVANLVGANVVIISRSNIVGRPLSALLLKENCTVTICHSKTKNLQSITSRADIVVSAIGVAQFLTTDYFKKSSVIIDVGISRAQNGRLLGDVDFYSVKNIAKYITPVPGGVGPMTIAFLLFNTLKASLWQRNLHDILETLEKNLILPTCL